MKRWNGIIAGWIAAVVAAGGCIERKETVPQEDRVAAERARVQRALEFQMGRIEAWADSIDRLFKPLPVMKAAEEASLRRYLSASHLERARRLGVPRPANEAEAEALRSSGRLVVVESSSPYWVVRELEQSTALATPDTKALLMEIGKRFQARLERLGLPAYRFEITSALRTSRGQTALRQVNSNAAQGVSAHEFGTTVDIAYSAFAAPAEPILRIDVPEAPWLEPHLRRVAAARAESVGARRALELKAILGDVLREMQAEGDVLVTLERDQPVFHITVARRR